MGKKTRHLLLQLGLLLFVASACDTTVKTDKAAIGDAVVKEERAAPTDTFAVDTARSEITWIGAKMTGRHNGVIDIQQGEFYMTNGLVTGGNIEMNMATIRSADKTIDEKSNQKLTTHLRSPDFFDSERYPGASFELTGIAPYDSTTGQSSNITPKDSELRVKNPSHRITGNLTIRSQTKSVSFPARVTLADTLLRAKANFNIDRTKWGLVYRSDNSLGDKTIRAEVNIGLDIVAISQKP
ncbi:YceI family protein [Pontibacter anaerobius]|uniref:YceI family protein n=1 Tax=Pontibacter anaerobius TaxID=2993940 RepID=A0ABT3RID2_9BACT|nr:YceI family protein [Pontibacter anaerobius]MCX2741243.1 YceI family protein [Pontibacter anaerobius]